jgi:hypothetical protein
MQEELNFVNTAGRNQILQCIVYYSTLRLIGLKSVANVNYI